MAAGYPRVSAVLPGGETRTASTLAALAHLGDADCLLLLHDAARPLLPARVVTDCLAALADHGAVATAVPSTDTVFEVGPAGTITGVPPRATLRRAQTPQGFHADVLRRAYAAAADDPDFVATDDCSVVHRYLPDVPGRGRRRRRGQPQGHQPAGPGGRRGAAPAAWRRLSVRSQVTGHVAVPRLGDVGRLPAERLVEAARAGRRVGVDLEPDAVAAARRRRRR